MPFNTLRTATGAKITPSPHPWPLVTRYLPTEEHYYNKSNTTISSELNRLELLNFIKFRARIDNAHGQDVHRVFSGVYYPRWRALYLDELRPLLNFNSNSQVKIIPIHPFDVYLNTVPDNSNTAYASLSQDNKTAAGANPTHYRGNDFTDSLGYYNNRAKQIKAETKVNAYYRQGQIDNYDTLINTNNHTVNEHYKYTKNNNATSYTENKYLQKNGSALPPIPGAIRPPGFKGSPSGPDGDAAGIVGDDVINSGIKFQHFMTDDFAVGKALRLGPTLSQRNHTGTVTYIITDVDYTLLKTPTSALHYNNLIASSNNKTLTSPSATIGRPGSLRSAPGPAAGTLGHTLDLHYLKSTGTNGDINENINYPPEVVQDITQLRDAFIHFYGAPEIGIKELARYFSSPNNRHVITINKNMNNNNIDNHGDRRINKRDFIQALREVRMELPPERLDAIFAALADQSPGSADLTKTTAASMKESIPFETFMLIVRGPLSEKRRAVIAKVFHFLDKDGDGIISPWEMYYYYNKEEHPDVLSGLLTPQQVLTGFLSIWGNHNNSSSSLVHIHHDELLYSDKNIAYTTSGEAIPNHTATAGTLQRSLRPGQGLVGTSIGTFKAPNSSTAEKDNTNIDARTIHYLNNNKNAAVYYTEFYDYYNGISAMVADDDEFINIIWSSWKIKG